ncbi:PepSY-associated TM helix domain-containing protein [Cognaticolwellia mytili]|uniref:PepSY-associated TM helix domain-containing protein n=1 Tax=Cognaticolwellia mytili TaxID=1888913 RepID=UPI000A16E7F6|nr:PepSY-associated TM helix domain-containing protein [Cognaticolwellia mytili]
MKSETLKNALNAHGWVGLIISLPLFIVFWAGAITFFQPELEQWATLPYYNIDTEAKTRGDFIDYNNLVEEQIKIHGVLPGERISLLFPNEKSPFLKMYFPVPVVSEKQFEKENIVEQPIEAKKVKKKYLGLLIDPYSGEVFTEHSPFEFAHFLYELHYNLQLPQGLYIVGIITLFFFVITITGVVVQLKKIVKNFFLYRKDQTTRSQMTDMHNVIGVISLPYAIMYALSGVILNLLILVQIPSVLVLYKGDLNGVTQDAGFYTHKSEASDESIKMPDLKAFADSLSQKHQADITQLNIYAYGDKNAVLQFRGFYNNGFHKSFSRFYQVSTNSYPESMNLPEDNVFAEGLQMLYSMHFANYAGTDMRLIYFVLAIAFCSMIIAGNVLWVVKRQKKNEYPKTLAFTRGATLGGCIGVITATSICFFLERSLPEALNEREHVIEYAFGIILLLSTIAGFFVNKLRPFIGYNLIASGAFLCATVVFEWSVFGQKMALMIGNGYWMVGCVSAGMALIAVLLLWIGFKTLKYVKSEELTIIDKTDKALA